MMIYDNHFLMCQYHDGLCREKIIKTIQFLLLVVVFWFWFLNPTQYRYNFHKLPVATLTSI